MPQIEVQIKPWSQELEKYLNLNNLARLKTLRSLRWNSCTSNHSNRLKTWIWQYSDLRSLKVQSLIYHSISSSRESMWLVKVDHIGNSSQISLKNCSLLIYKLIPTRRCSLYSTLVQIIEPRLTSARVSSCCNHQEISLKISHFLSIWVFLWGCASELEHI